MKALFFQLSQINYCVYNKLLKEIKPVTYSSQGNHTGQLDFCTWMTDDSTTG